MKPSPRLYWFKYNVEEVLTSPAVEDLNDAQYRALHKLVSWAWKRGGTLPPDREALERMAGKPYEVIRPLLENEAFFFVPPDVIGFECAFFDLRGQYAAAKASVEGTTRGGHSRAAKLHGAGLSAQPSKPPVVNHEFNHEVSDDEADGPSVNLVVGPVLTAVVAGSGSCSCSPATSGSTSTSTAAGSEGAYVGREPTDSVRDLRDEVDTELGALHGKAGLKW